MQQSFEHQPSAACTGSSSTRQFCRCRIPWRVRITAQWEVCRFTTLTWTPAVCRRLRVQSSRETRASVVKGARASGTARDCGRRSVVRFVA